MNQTTFSKRAGRICGLAFAAAFLLLGTASAMQLTGGVSSYTPFTCTRTLCTQDSDCANLPPSCDVCQFVVSPGQLACGIYK